MIVTLTLNPSLDRAVEVPGLQRGAVIRSTALRLDPGGKGVNVARALLANGVEARAVLPVGGAVGRELVERLEDEGVAMTAVPVRATTRSNLTLSEPDGTVTKINEAGGLLTDAEIDLLADAVMRLAAGHQWVVLSGSLPTGTDDGVYARLTERFAAADLAVAVDTSGPALAQAIAARPALVKPNREELAEAAGRDVRSIAEAAAAAADLQQAGATAVLASLGPDGAVLAERDGVWLAECAVGVRRSTVGAGDCLLAGFLAAGATGPKALATAVSWAAAAVELPGSGIPTPDDIALRQEQVQLTDEFDRDRMLTVSG